MLKNDYKEINIEIKVPVDLVPVFKKAESDKMAYALLLYPLIQEGEISYGQAAKMLNVNKYDLIDYFGEKKLPYFNDDPDELSKEIETLTNDKRFAI